MMTRRFLLMSGAIGLAGAVGSTWWPVAPDAAEAFEVTHTDDEWRKPRVYESGCGKNQ